MSSLLLFILFEEYALTLSLFERVLALHNFLAFLSFFVQWRGLIGSRGIAPAHELIARLRARGWTGRTRWRSMPTLAWVSVSDDALWWIQVGGLVASSFSFFGLFTGWSILISAICYSSIKCVGSVFTQLQMHAHIMEIDIIYFCCSPFLHVAPSSLVVLASLLNFRVMMGGGAGKWFGGDKTWRSGTAMSFHYWTQPLPNPLSPLMHRLPAWVHRLETYASLVCESGGALFVFAPVPLRFLAFTSFIGLMALINLTGNFAQISVLTMNESILLLNDEWWRSIFQVLGHVLPFTDQLQSWLLFTHAPPYVDLALRPTREVYSVWNVTLAIVPYVLFIVPYAAIQLLPLVGTFRGHNALELFDPLTPRPHAWYREMVQSEWYGKHVRPVWKRVWTHLEQAFAWGTTFDLFSSYVKFGHMTKFRHEIQIESSLDGVEWREYVFRYKPSSLTRRPPFWPVHLPAMDWRLWFLPLEHARGGEAPLWFIRLLSRLLACEPHVLALFHSTPFDGVRTPRPKMIRAVLYDYRFAYRYEMEDDLKRLVKHDQIRDTEIDTSSEEEIEVREEPEVEKEAVKEETSPEPVRRRHQSRSSSRAPSIDSPSATTAAAGPSASSSSEQAQEEEEVKFHENIVDEKKQSATKRHDAKKKKKDVALEPPASSQPPARHRAHQHRDDSHSVPHTDPAPTVPPQLHAGPLTSSHASSQVDESSEEEEEEEVQERESREDRRSREALARLFGILLPGSRVPSRVRRAPAPGHVWRRVKKVTLPTPQKDEQGQHIWYVRRHRIGPYGPTLERHDTPPPPSAAPLEPWQEFMNDPASYE